jgi:predicted dehydrogenase
MKNTDGKENHKHNKEESNSSEGISKPANPVSRRFFLRSAGLAAIGLGLQQVGCSVSKKAVQQNAVLPAIQGFEDSPEGQVPVKSWQAISDRKIRVGIAGYGVCRFGAQFGFQNHPNVEIVAVSDLFPDRVAELAKICNCSRTYPSLEEMIKQDDIEAVFIATDAPSHANLAIEALKRGKHVASAVPAVYGSLEDAQRLFEAVRSSGMKYMMFETSCYREDLYAMRKIYEAGGMGEIVYSEGEYYHYMSEPIDSYKGWRIGLPPQWYPTHSNAYHIGVTSGSFTDVSCLGMPSIIDHLKAENNQFKNPFGTEIANFKASEGGMSRMAVSWDTPGDHGERGRLRGQIGSFYGKYQGQADILPNIMRPALPPGVPGGGHGGSHGYLMDEFVTAILKDRKPLVDIAMALNLTVAGIVAHQSALKDGEWMKIPQFKF